jgi:DNA-directed RNA polymerase subunit beta'
MILENVPVLPPDLRPLVPLEGGRFATSDLNDLYRRVINRNNRLKRLLELSAPEIIIRNEKRMLQEAVDAVFDNGRHGRPVLGAGNRPLKSLADMLKGKQGRFRQNLLGKRVDYSGRSVIVIGPELKLHQCGLPKQLALELFEPFIIKVLKERGYVHSIKSAKRMVEKVRPEVWDILAEVIKGHPVLLNRAPTLHRLGIQAFEPVLIEGKAIRIHPFVCTAFNADFDGDQMAVHVPLSIEAQIESRLLMMATNNLFSPANGHPITTPTQDLVIGCNYLTKEKKGVKGEGKVFADIDEVIMAHIMEEVNLHALIKVRLDEKIIDTTVGRIIFNDSLPKGIKFINQEMDKKALTILIKEVFDTLGKDGCIELLDSLKSIGFEYATRGGITAAIDHFTVPKEKKELIANAKAAILKVEQQYRQGLITSGERYNKIIDIWTHTKDVLSDILFGDSKDEEKSFNPIFMMTKSGARGNRDQIEQLAGMRGLIAKPTGEIIETPIIANLREGLTVQEYFISAHGARKGLADTALKTADAGYLTRRLVDVSQDVIITMEDCKTVNGISVSGIYEAEEAIEALSERILGRTALEDISIPLLGNVIVKSGEEIDEEAASQIEEAGIEEVKIRSLLTCEIKYGVCAKCYGRNLAAQRTAVLGEAVGIVAAQSIGEPGTQLTMRTFHIGGIASRTVEESKITAKHTGCVRYHNLRTVKNKEGRLVVLNRNGSVSIHDEKGKELERYLIPSGSVIKTPANETVKEKEVFVEWDPYTSSIFTEVKGRVRYDDIIEGVTMREELDKATGLVTRVIIEHREDRHPQIIIENEKGEAIIYYSIPTGAHIVAKDREKVEGGSLLAKTPRELVKTRDITVGLPRVAELFEARRPKEPAIISEIDGEVHFAGSAKGMRKILIKSESGMEKNYLIPHGRHLSVYKGDRVVAGQQLVEGPVVLQDILRVCGDKKLQQYLLNEVQEVYRLQGIKINDKHIEIIIRQMLRKVIIEDAGDTNFLIGEQVDKFRYREENERVVKLKKKAARAIPILLGITKAALSTDSFISAASFQETTRVLTEAACSSRVDYLRGLKENVIMGHLILAGTGFPKYQEIEVIRKNADDKSTD